MSSLIAIEARMLRHLKPYFTFNREERHLAAVLFHILCLGDNPRRLLDAFKLDWKWVPEEAGVYFEYSYLRDLWDSFGKGAGANDKKLLVLLTILKDFGATPEFLGRFTELKTVEFNKIFINRPSTDHIQSPANWQVGTFAAVESVSTAEDILAFCHVKWAFRAKPDVVIQPSLERALCLELKVESGEGSYPALGSEIALLRGRGLYEANIRDPLPMRQTALQAKMMRYVFGEENVHMGFVTRHSPKLSDDVPARAAHLSWDTLLATLMLPDPMPPFVAAALDSIRLVPLEAKTLEAPTV